MTTTRLPNHRRRAGLTATALAAVLAGAGCSVLNHAPSRQPTPPASSSEQIRPSSTHLAPDRPGVIPTESPGSGRPTAVAERPPRVGAGPAQLRATRTPIEV